MDANVFQTHPQKPATIVTVRDVFDRCEARAVLSDYFAVVADDVVALLSDVVRSSPITRRFVNVYAYNSAHNAYTLVRNDLDLIQYLHTSGLRVVPVSTKADLDALRTARRPIPVQQSTNHVLACAPTAFSYNAAAAADNHFMPVTAQPALSSLRRAVLSEFAQLHDVLTRRDGAGAQVHLFTHEDWHNTPDACFPNNTFSTHTNLETGSDCVLVLYPMKAATRRKERRLVQRLLSRGRYSQVLDFTHQELAEQPAFLEGTGSLVLDRLHRVAYVAQSARSDLRLARAWADAMNYSLVPFSAVDAQQRPIYHTNVMMCVGTRLAVVCTECIVDARERAAVLDALKSTRRVVVEIGFNQVESFCGNVLELEDFYGDQILVMSSGAYRALDDTQRALMLTAVERLVHADIPTIERVGGGGVRCTIAELY